MARQRPVVISAGAVVQSKEPPHHHFIVLSDPNEQNEVLLVICSDVLHYQYEPVRLQKGDHHFVEKETALVLSMARRVHTSVITKNIPYNFEPRAPLDFPVLHRL